jgi:hypothetical protein
MLYGMSYPDPSSWRAHTVAGALPFPRPGACARPQVNYSTLPHRQSTDNRQEYRRKQHKNKKQRGCPLMIATHMKDLEDEDPDCILMIRHVQRLGFDSAEILRVHYNRYGTVVKVLLSNRHEKQASARLRPSGIALVLMQNPEDVANVLKVGEVQTIHGVEVHLRVFKRKDELIHEHECAETASEGQMLRPR